MWVGPWRIFSLWAILICACSTAEEVDEQPIAVVHQFKLFPSDVRNVVTGDMSPADSLAVLRAFTERWVREKLLLHQAELKIPEELAIDKLVADYRNSLILVNYERQLVEQSLDTVISDVDLEQYYQKNKEQYQLEAGIVRCLYAIVPKKADRFETFKKLFNKPFSDLTSQSDLKEAVEEYSTSASLNASRWFKIEDIIEKFPKWGIRSKDLKKDACYSYRATKEDYHIRVLEAFSKEHIAPLSYIRDQAKRAILHQRKIELLEHLKESLYERESKTGNLKINLE